MNVPLLVVVLFMIINSELLIKSLLTNDDCILTGECTARGINSIFFHSTISVIDEENYIIPVIAEDNSYAQISKECKYSMILSKMVDFEDYYMTATDINPNRKDLNKKEFYFHAL